MTDAFERESEWHSMLCESVEVLSQNLTVITNQLISVRQRNHCSSSGSKNFTINMGNSSSSSSSPAGGKPLPPSLSKLNNPKTDLEQEQHIAFFAQYEKVPENYFWSCKVTQPPYQEETKTKQDISSKNIVDDNNNDVFLMCDIGVHDPERRTMDEVPSTNVRMWMKKDHGSRYTISSQTPATLQDQERKFFPLLRHPFRRLWIDDTTGRIKMNLPKGLFQEGVEIGPQHDDIEFFKKMTDPKEVDKAVSPKNGWRGKPTFEFQIYSAVLADAAMKRAMSNL